MKLPHKCLPNWHTRPSYERPYTSSDICPLSDPLKPHELDSQWKDKPPLSLCFGCNGGHFEGTYYYFSCHSCRLQFHRGCNVIPLIMKHPLHPAHALTLVSLDPNFDTSKIPHQYNDIYYNDDSNDDDDDDAGDDHEAVSPSYKHYQKCKCCCKRIEQIYYHCSICRFSLNFTCTINPPPPSIIHRKNHDHILTLFPRRIPLPCDACGLSLKSIRDVVYACLPCNYMVHRKCIKLPRVIKITRHQHRLSFIPSFPSGDFSCGVCRLTIDVSYGHYSCNKECHYAVHSKCATREDVWDGQDLEGAPEEPEEDIEPFIRIDEETIQHFTHDHFLKLQLKGSFHGEQKFCEACCLTISTFDAFYGCMQCDFVLHEACACLPRIKHHPLHKHPLILHQSIPSFKWPGNSYVDKSMFDCNGCLRRGTGFMYKCGTYTCRFQLDVRCASIPDTLVHGSHSNDDHPFFINLTKGECMCCKSTSCSGSYLECMRCKSFLGLHCATLPSVAYYKYDRHPLTLSYGEKDTTNGQYWCELCETTLDASEWFYTCDSCRVTLHVTCLLGIDMYMKPQHIIRKGGKKVEIIFNDTQTRPFCYTCSSRCIKTSVFKCKNEHFCTWKCFIRFL